MEYINFLKTDLMRWLSALILLVIYLASIEIFMSSKRNINEFLPFAEIFRLIVSGFKIETDIKTLVQCRFQ